MLTSIIKRLFKTCLVLLATIDKIREPFKRRNFSPYKIWKFRWRPVFVAVRNKVAYCFLSKFLVATLHIRKLLIFALELFNKAVKVALHFFHRFLNFVSVLNLIFHRTLVQGPNYIPKADTRLD